MNVRAKAESLNNDKFIMAIEIKLFEIVLDIFKDVIEICNNHMWLMIQ